MCKAFEDHYKSGVREGRREGREAGLREGEQRGRIAGKTEGILEGRQENEKRFQSLIAAMVKSGEAGLLPRLAEPGGFLTEMYQKYSL